MRQVVGMSADGSTITLERFQGDLDWSISSNDLKQSRKAMFLDLETTGINASKDKIIDIGYVIFSYHKETGEILGIEKEFSQQQDPGVPLSEKIKKLTGYKDEDLQGKQIDWSEVKADFDKVDVIIAHNAAFDRSFADKILTVSQDKIWACSMTQIAWLDKGHRSKSLENLAHDHGFFFQGHTALMDVKASLYLINRKDPDTSQTYFFELLSNARISSKWVIAFGASFEMRQELKDRGYMWDPGSRVWKIAVPVNNSEEEDFLQSHPLAGHAQVKNIRLVDHFKV